MFLNKNTFGRKALSVMLAAAMISSVAITTAVTTSAAKTTEVEAQATATTAKSGANQYGLKDNVQDGVILHAWQWSFKNIKEQLPKIAEAGYTAVQTSVVQRSKEGTVGKGNSGWWVFYQPAAFEIDNTGNSALGTKADLEALCTEAEKYGIKVIVDVVANHLGNSSSYDLSPAIPDDIRNDSNCWHPEGFSEINYGNRYSITHGSMGGLPDLNTENPKIQNYVSNYLKECIDVGVDGFRFDAAKHISVPDEGSQYNFWPTVLGAATSHAQSTKNFTPYYYGEVLYQTTEGGGPAITSYTKYMSVTDDSTGNGIRGAVNGGNAAGAAKSTYDKGTSPDKLVLWAESHDTYSNENKQSTYVSDSNINKTWALVGSRNKSSALYFARTQGYRGGTMGNIYSTQCFNKEVAEVNKFHNYFAGQSEYLASSGSIAYNERGTEGVVLVNVGGSSQQVSVKANKMKDGTYKDQVSGNTFTVSGGTISGQIGNTGIAVVYNAVPQAGISATPGTAGSTYKYKTDTLTVTLNATNVSNAKYSIDGGAATAYTDGTKVTLGSGKAYETSQTLTLTGTNTTTNAAISQTYTYFKTNQGTTIYFDNSSYNWSKVYAYIYTGEGETAQSVAAWPGVQLTNKSAKSGYLYYDLPDGFDSASVIWSDGVDGTSNRYPADMEPGLSIGGSSKLFSSGKTWKDYSETVDPTAPTAPTNPTSPTDPTTVDPPVGSYVKGDVTGDNKVGMKDCAVIQKYLLGSVTLDATKQLAADVNGDKEIGTTDVVIIMKYLVGFENTFSVGSVVSGPVDPTDPTSTDPTAPTSTDPTDPPVGGSTVYLNASAINTGDERYAIYVWKTESDSKWVDMTSAGSGLYQANVPDGYTNIIFCRMNGATSENNWNTGTLWNQSADLTFNSSQNLFTATGWNGAQFNGNWSSQGPIDPTNPPVGNNVVYLNASAINTGDERYAIYVWKSESDSKWVDMTSAGSGLY
ncbi:MAG: alpha-amylase family glycosyl hydrolase, partial [Acutalibacteraceae bacterium]|nr:alpha-amylase family glycosyl hydrolase [Acutalibacteraceae bacterium]